MSLAGHQTPPIFHRGPPPQARLAFFVTVCLLMLIVDIRFQYLKIVRDGLSVVIYPLQRLATIPADIVVNASRYFATLATVQQENSELRNQHLNVEERLLRQDHLERENRQLRGLLEMSRRIDATSQTAEILYSAPDPFARKVILDRGSQHGVETGYLVVDDKGVIGQITQVHPVQAEVTLLTDRHQAIAVEVVRNGLRGVVYGTGRGKLEMRYVVPSGDIEPEDILVTSGLDGQFVPGLPVATVSTIDKEHEPFADIRCEPLAGVDTSIQVLILGRRTDDRAEQQEQEDAAD